MVAACMVSSSLDSTDLSTSQGYVRRTDKYKVMQSCGVELGERISH